MKRFMLTVTLSLCAGSLTAHAQFGSGIVFDPTQSGHAIVQIKNEEQSIANQVQQIEDGQKIFTNTVKIATTALQTYNTVQQQYNLYHQMILAPKMLYARFLSPQSDLMLMQQVSNTYGNSMGWLNASNTGAGATASYQQAVVPRTPNMVPGYGTTSVAGQQQISAQGATIDIGDSVMSTNLQVLGTIRANQLARQTDITNLENASQNQDPGQQTIMATLQRINQALLLQLRTQQDANQINADLALQQMIAQKQQQDTLKVGFMDAGNFNSTYQTQVAPAYNGAAQALTY
jgi:hypothetical protein